MSERRNLVVCHIASVDAMGDAIDAVRELTHSERRFGLLLAVSARRSLDDYLSIDPAARSWLRLHRVAVGTWCLGVGYVWLDPQARLYNRRHLQRAPFVWGTYVEAFACVREARVWLDARLGDAATAPAAQTPAAEATGSTA